MVVVSGAGQPTMYGPGGVCVSVDRGRGRINIVGLGRGPCPDERVRAMGMQTAVWIERRARLKETRVRRSIQLVSTCIGVTSRRNREVTERKGGRG